MPPSNVDPGYRNRGMTLQSVLKHPTFRLSCFSFFFAASPVRQSAVAEGTRTWEQSKFDDLVKGTANGVAIRSTGGLELAPSFKLLYATPSTYIWAVAADDAGNVYAADRISRARVSHHSRRQVDDHLRAAGTSGAGAQSWPGRRNLCSHCARRQSLQDRAQARRESAKPPSPTAKPPTTRQRCCQAGVGFLLEFVRLLRAGHEIYLGPPLRQGRKSLRRHRAITARSTKSRRKAITRFSSRATKPTSVCSRSMRRET